MNGIKYGVGLVVGLLLCAACAGSSDDSDVARLSDTGDAVGVADVALPCDAVFDPDATLPDEDLVASCDGDTWPGADAEGTDADVGPTVDTTQTPYRPLVDDEELGRQWGPEVAALVDGGFVVVWMSVPPEGGTATVRYRIFHRTGTPRTDPSPVDPDATLLHGFPAVAPLKDGGFVVAWPAVMLGDPSSYGLEARVFESNGNARSAVTTVSALDTRNQRDVHLATLAGGDLVMTWEWDRYDGSSAGVVARVLAPSLVPRGANFLPAQVTEDAQSTPRVAALPDGGFVVTWESTITAGYDVRARFFDADGAPASDEVPVNLYDTNGVQRSARPLALASGDVLVAHTDENMGLGVSVRLVDGDTHQTVWSADVQGALQLMGGPALARSNTGAALFFHGREAIQEAHGIWRADWDATERTVSTPSRLYADEGRGSNSPEAVTLRDGGIVVVWECADADREGVCMALEYDAIEGPPDWDSLECPLAWETCAPVMPGCYFSEECPELDDCPISGCGTDGPEVESIVFGHDQCGVPWVELREASGRLTTHPWRELAGPYETPIFFDVLLDGVPTTQCEIVGLPTGAIRYQLTCRDGGEVAYMAVLEPMDYWGCDPCEDVSGCYELETPPILCNAILPCPTPPSRARIAMTQECSFSLRLEEPPAQEVRGWVSSGGLLTFSAQIAGEGVSCTLQRDGDTFGPAVCIVPSSLGGGILRAEGYLTPLDDAECALPECILDATCEALRIGDECREGICRCDGEPACTEGHVCAPGSGAPGSCAPEELWDDARACTEDADCRTCLAGEIPACCDQIIDGSALDAVNVFHDCPTCCTCEQSCEGVTAPADVECGPGGRCRYVW